MRGKHRNILTDFFKCDKDIDLSNMEKLIKIRNIIGVEVIACENIPKSGYLMDVLEL